MRWLAPPDRRELTLILVSLLAYFFAYNLDASLHLLGVDPVATRGAVLSQIGLAKTKSLGVDGRKPAGWRDKMEDEIFGEWSWDEGHIANDEADRQHFKGEGRHGGMWLDPKDVDLMNGEDGMDTVDRALAWWRKEVPQTRVLRHVPGYTVLDNVFIYKKAMYMVTDDRTSFPNISSIVSSPRPAFTDWQVLSQAEGAEKLGGYGGVIRGVTWMSMDATPDNSTLFALWRAYSSLDSLIDQQGRTTLASPRRLWFPELTVFTDPDPSPLDFSLTRRRRVDTGFHPYTAKAAFPRTPIMYLADLEDYQKTEVPYLIERLVVADREAAREAVPAGKPSFSPVFDLEASAKWWQPVRMAMARYFDVHDEKTMVRYKNLKVVTYLHRQGESNGAKLSAESHEKLVKALQQLKNYGYEVNILPCAGMGSDWESRMGAVVRSTVVLGDYGDHLFDFVFMKDSPQSTLMEFFPVNTFLPERGFAAQAIGVRYLAWWGNREFSSDKLPAVSDLEGNHGIFEVDAAAVTRIIRDIL